jgi:hypothetical protein
MQDPANISTVANAIQLSVAPVFLLTGIGATLSVMAHRLARVVDRFRALRYAKDKLHPRELAEMHMLLRRSRWVHWAISLSTVSALFVCIVIAALFTGSELKFDPSRLVSLLFIVAMVSLIAGLLCFVREIHLSIDTIQKKDVEESSA